MGLLINKRDRRPSTRTYDGKKYKSGGVLFTKREAEAETHWNRKRGRPTRIEKVKGGYLLFVAD